jgi:hypothetical protein
MSRNSLIFTAAAPNGCLAVRRRCRPGEFGDPGTRQAGDLTEQRVMHHLGEAAAGERLRNAYAGVFRRKAASRTGETTGRQMLDGWSVQAINRQALLSSAR